MIEQLSLRSSMLAMAPSDANALIDRLDNLNPTALAAYRPDKHKGGELLGRRGATAILYVAGPLFKRDSIITQFMGFATYERLRRDFQVALNDRSVKSIMLHVDSPGGEANGCDELATAIYEARGQKPIEAYVSGMACSGGYWIASAASRITVSESAIVGSIGVAMTVTDRSKANDAKGITHREFVSSKSPGKRPDINAKEGRATVQKMVDDLGDVFIQAVARHRGVSTSTVASNFGAGGVEVGKKAVAAGLVDRIGQFEAAIAGLSGGIQPSSTFQAAARLPQVTGAPEPAVKLDQAALRIQAILNSKEGKDHPKLALKYATETNYSVERARAAIVDDAIQESWRRAIANATI